MAKIAGVHEFASVSLTGSGSFTGGTIRFSKVGRLVTASVTSLPTHASLSSVVSATNLVPSWAIPSSTKRNVYLMTSNAIYQISITSSGQVAFLYYDGALAPVNRVDSNENGSVSYLV
jgi:hypothetical protein